MFTDEELEAAVRALSEPERFEGAERLVSAAAPQLHRILGQALDEGGWFGEAHASQVREAAREPDEAQRVARIADLIAEETRMGMLIGVAVGWQLARELGKMPEAPGPARGMNNPDEPNPSGGT
jgi:hypothetical protein